MPKPISYNDVFRDPREITIAKLWALFEKVVGTAMDSDDKREDMRRCFYAGFCECFKIHFDMSTELTEEEAVVVLSALSAETREFFEQMKAHYLPRRAT